MPDNRSNETIIEESLVIQDRGVFATVGIQIDVDRCMPQVLYMPRREGRVIISIDPDDVPRLARMLNKAAKAAKEIRG